jgi:hypothetical protein
MLLLAYGDETMSRVYVFEWFKIFEEGWTTVESDEREGRPLTNRNEEMIQKIRTAIRGNRRLIIMELINEFKIAFGSVQTILTTDLATRRVAAKFVQKLLCITIMHQQRRVQWVGLVGPGLPWFLTFKYTQNMHFKIMFISTLNTEYKM